MRLVYYEIRKNFFRKYLILIFFTFLLLNILTIYGNYRLGAVTEISTDTAGMKAGYQNLHNKLDGKITVNKVKFVIEEESRLNALTADNTYSRSYQPDTYTGYLFGDYYLIRKYFYQPMQYAALYTSNMEEILKKAEDNTGFYEKYGNNPQKMKNRFILNHYGGRKITDFYNMRPWESLLDYDFSDFLILFLVILGLVPLYVNEKESRMEYLIRTSKGGRFDMSAAKLLASALYILFLVTTFSMENYSGYRTFCGLFGGALPLYALETYQNTPFNCSTLSFYLLFICFKLLGVLVFAFLVCCFSRVSYRVIYPYMAGVLTLAAGVYISGYATSVESGKSMLALFSPLTLLKSQELLKELHGFTMGTIFGLDIFLALALQAVLLILLILFVTEGNKLLLLFWKKKNSISGEGRERQ